MLNHSETNFFKSDFIYLIAHGEILGCPAQGQEFDSMILMVAFKHSMFHDSMTISE